MVGASSLNVFKKVDYDKKYEDGLLQFIDLSAKPWASLGEFPTGDATQGDLQCQLL